MSHFFACRRIKTDIKLCDLSEETVQQCVTKLHKKYDLNWKIAVVGKREILLMTFIRVRHYLFNNSAAYKTL